MVKALLLLSAVAYTAAADHRSAQIRWDLSTLTLVQRNAVYGRMARLPDQNVLGIYERAARVYTRLSRDDGRTWEEERLVAGFAFGTAANPEIAVLANGWLIAGYNERPNDGVHHFAIKVLTSRDHGETWSEPRLVYQAGTENGLSLIHI